jgi:hypothetical protein
MEEDWSAVRVHTDAQSNQLNRILQSRAFTTGKDVFFRHGEYNPSSSEGQALIAHELTHVMQQGKSGGRSPEIQRKLVIGKEEIKWLDPEFMSRVYQYINAYLGVRNHGLIWAFALYLAKLLKSTEQYEYDDIEAVFESWILGEGETIFETAITKTSEPVNILVNELNIENPGRERRANAITELDTRRRRRRGAGTVSRTSTLPPVETVETLEGKVLQMLKTGEWTYTSLREFLINVEKKMGRGSATAQRIRMECDAAYDNAVKKGHNREHLKAAPITLININNNTIKIMELKGRSIYLNA